MNWDAIGAVGEILGAIAVFVTLLYVAVQIRQNTKALRISSSSYINDALANLQGAIRSDADFADIWLRGCQSVVALTEIERARFSSHLLEMLNLAEYIHRLEQQEVLETHIDFVSWMALLYRDNPGIRAFLDSIETVGSQELLSRVRDPSNAKGANVFSAGFYRGASRPG